MSNILEYNVIKAFLSIIEAHEWIYVPGKKITDATEKSRKWEQLKETVDSCGLHVIADPKEVWRKMREHFVRRHKLGKEEQLNYYNDIKFLLPFIHHKNNSENAVQIHSVCKPPQPLTSFSLQLGQNNCLNERNHNDDETIIMDAELDVEEIQGNDVIMQEDFGPSTNNEIFQNEHDYVKMNLDSNDVSPPTSFQPSKPTSKTSEISTALRHSLPTMPLSDVSHNTASKPTSKTSEISAALRHSLSTMPSPDVADNTVQSLRDFFNMNSSRENMSPVSFPSSLSASHSASSTASPFSSSGSEISIQKVPIAPVSVSMFTKKKDNRDAVQSSSRSSRARSKSSSGLEKKNRKFSGFTKFTPRIVPPHDDFALRKRQKEKADTSAATEAMSSISKNITSVSSKLNDYIALKTQLVNSQLLGDTSDDLLKIINREFNSLSFSDQQKILPKILDEIEGFIRC